MKRLALVFIVGLLLLGACAPKPQSEPAIEEGFVRLRIENVGSIDYPPDFLELQSQEYRDVAKYYKEEYYPIIDFSKPDFTLQQVGLNELLPSAFEEYRRVMFWTFYMNPGEEVFRANEKYTMSREELTELENQIVDGLIQGFEAQGMGNKLVESVSLEIKEVNRMFPLVHTYKRQLNDNPVVLVQTYMFQNYDRIHHLAFSYRVVDEEECRDIYDKILNSFRLESMLP